MQAIAIQADSTDPEAVVAAVERTVVELGGVDMLVNNAGIGPLALIDDVSSGPEAGFVTGANLTIDGGFTA